MWNIMKMGSKMNWILESLLTLKYHGSMNSANLHIRQSFATLALLTLWAR